MAPVHADKVDGTIARTRHTAAQSIGKKCAELGRTHLAGSHRELTVLRFYVGMALDGDVVGRIEKCAVNFTPTANNVSDKVSIAPVSTSDPMLAQLPNVTRASSRIFTQTWDGLIVGIGRRAKQDIDLCVSEAGHVKIDLNVRRCELAQLEPQ